MCIFKLYDKIENLNKCCKRIESQFNNYICEAVDIKINQVVNFLTATLKTKVFEIQDDLNGLSGSIRNISHELRQKVNVSSLDGLVTKAELSDVVEKTLTQV
jgi:hypothetical protein